jgi:hypothetical protein
MAAALVVGHRDVEVVEPEVGHDLGELVLGLHGAPELLGHELAGQLALGAVALLLGPHHHGATALFLVLRVLRNHAGPARLGPKHPRTRIGARDLGGGHLQGGQAVEPALELPVGQVGHKLALQPAVEPHLHDGLDLARPGAIGEAVEEMGRGLALGEPGLLPGHADRWLMLDGGQGKRDGQDRGEGQGYGTHRVPPSREVKHRGRGFPAG